MRSVRLADDGEAADLAAFLARLVGWDKAAVVRLRATGRALAVFGRPPFGSGVLAVRTSELLEPVTLDATVSAGQFLETVDGGTAQAAVPAGVTGPSWAGVLPPRGGWQRIAELPSARVRGMAAAVVAEFRSRTEALPHEERTRQRLDAMAEEIWSRKFEATALPLRAVHAARALGFLRPVPAMATVAPGGADMASGGAPRAKGHDAEGTPVLFSCGPWLRLGTAHGSVIVRRAGGPGPVGLLVAPREMSA